MGFMIAIGSKKHGDDDERPMGGMRKGMGEGSDDEEGDEKSYALSAAKDLLSALKSGDAKAVDSALRAHYEACQGE